jgi:putative glutamine amidotransferase
MKRVLLTQRLAFHEPTGEVRDCLDIRWAELANALGWLAIPFPSGAPPRDFLSEIPCDALVLTGGNDLASVSADPLSARRDAFETDLLRAFLALDRPVLGVCRGMQLVGSAFGMGLKPVSGHAGTRVGLLTDPGSRFRSALEGIGEVNAYHDYALEEVEAPFIVSARSPDGVIKAMEWPGRKVFCQMWHSERETPFSAAELAVLRQAMESVA